MSDWLGQLRESVDAHDARSRQWQAGDGTLLLTDYGARILACDIDGAGGNLFWHNPALNSPTTASDALASAGGDIGGDRLWLAPEIGFMWPDQAEARIDPVTSYALPTSMDPAPWTVREAGSAHVLFASRITLTDHRLSKPIAADAQREIETISPPANLPSQLRCVSFGIRNSIALVAGDQGAVVGTWDLLQLPVTGTLICPVASIQGQPRSYYDPFGDRHVQSDGKCVRFLIDAKRRVKMGLLPEQTLGRMGYYRQLADGQASLIVRYFASLPGEPYVDLPLDSDQLTGGDALQAYNDDRGSAYFGEMEYHDPGLVAGCGPTTRTGYCTTHVLVGPDAEIRAFGEALLGVPIQPIA